MSDPAGEFERLLTEAEFGKALRAAQAAVPYTRELEGYPSYLLLTEAQWENYDSFNAHHDEMERKYGRLIPQSAAALFSLARRIW